MPGRALSDRQWWRALATVFDALRSDPRRTLALLPRTQLGQKRDLRRFSLAVHGRTVLADIYAAAAETGFRPFLMWGTLLGAIREGGPLAHDNDLDLGILPTDYPHRERFVAAMVKRGYIHAFDQRYKFRLLRRDRVLHIDFDLFYPHDRRMICLAGNDETGHSGASFPADLFGTPQAMTILDGVAVLVPEKPEAVLEAIYGPGWRIPNPGYRSSIDLLNRLSFAPGQAIPEPPGA